MIKGAQGKERKNMVGVAFDDFAFHCLKQAIKKKKQVLSRYEDEPRVTKSEIVRQAVVYFFFHFFKGYDDVKKGIDEYKQKWMKAKLPWKNNEN